MLFLQYGLVAAALLALAAGFYRVVLPTASPDFSLKSVLDTQRLLNEITELAYRSRNFAPRGAGLSIRLMKKQIDRAFTDIGQRAAEGKTELFGFEHWLYDNYYKLCERMLAIRREAHKFAFLPHTDGLPRVYLMCERLVKSSGGYVDFELLQQSVSYFNAETPLTYPEIMALRFALEYALLEFIAIFAAKSLKIARLRERAFADAGRGRADLVYLRYNSYTDTLYRHSSEHARRNIAKLCENNGASAASRGESFYASIARYDGAVGCAIRCLHKLPEILTDLNLLTLSAAGEVLQSEPHTLYNELTPATKHLYLYHIYKLAKRTKTSEPAVAGRAIKAALEKGRDVSFEILPRERGRGLAALYILTHIVLTALLSVAAGMLSAQFKIAVALVSLPVAYQISSILCADVLQFAVKRRELPAKAIQEHNLHENATVITVPRLIADKAEIADAFSHMETLIAANPSPVFSYCLLFDFPAADSEQAECDTELLDACCEAYACCEQKERLMLLVRKRKQIAGGKKFQGWEKKRGVLLDFNSYILSGNSDAFSLCLGNIKQANYVVTLDCDTQVNSCLQLVEMMSHPFHAEKNIISFNISSIAASEKCTAFSKLFCGAVGLNRYTVTSASAEQDLFLKGNFTGKGIYRVHAFQKAVANAFYDNRLLCHDYIEGCFAGCLNSAQTTALDEFPESFSRFFIRQTRWLKGDWQLLPFLFGKVRGRDGTRYRNPISAIQKWHILSNMVHSLVPAASLALIVLALFFKQPLIPVCAAVLPYAIYCLKAIRSSVMRLSADFVYELIRQLFLFCALPVVAVYSLAAIFLTLLRLVRRKNLLEWKTFSHAKGRISFLPAIVFGAVLAVLTFILSASPIFYVIAACFVLAFMFEGILSRIPRQKPVRDYAFRKKLLDEFRAAYGYFIDHHSAAYRFLPCDNLQTTPKRRLAERTSPTNIGFAIVAHIAAYRLGIVERQVMLKYCMDIVGSIERLPKWHGNLYNWIDIKNGETLLPRYVSCVDSGNLLLAFTLLSTHADGELKRRVDKLINETEIERFFDPVRGLLHIGYNDDTQEMDAGFYDLAASEALATYLAAVAHGKIGSESVLNLSRQMFLYGGQKALASWTGGMFEYLMPALFFQFRKETALYRSACAAVRAQMRYAKRQRLPVWGISESQYAKTDGDGNYQYKAFGIPALALANNPCPSVVAPYASLLALPFAKTGAVKENLEALEKLGARGEYGFYESVDFAENHHTMRTFMAHHTGMSLAAIANYLTDGAMIKSLRNHPGIRAAELTLSGSEKPAARRKRQLCQPIPRASLPPPVVTNGRFSIPRVNLLSGGRYALVTDSRGGGYAMYDGISVTRPQTTELIAEMNGKPYRLLGGTFSSAYDCSVYEQVFSEFTSRVRVSILPGGNGEVREVTLFNRTDRPLSVTLKSKIEPVLRDRAGDVAHRAYSDLFLRADFDKVTETVKMYRRTEKIPCYVTHSIVSGYKTVYNTERRAYYGRGNFPLSVQQFPVEPVLSSHTEIIMPARKKAQASVFTVCAYDEKVLSAEIRSIKSHGFLAANREAVAAQMEKNRLSPLVTDLAAKLIYGSAGSVKEAVGNEYHFGGTALPSLYYRLRDGQALGRIKAELSELKKLYQFGIAFHLYLLYEERRGYFMTQNEAINAAIDELGIRRVLTGGSSIFLVNTIEQPQLARAITTNSLALSEADVVSVPERPVHPIKEFPPVELTPPKIVKPLGIGGITENYAYAVNLTDTDTPRPYSNILSNGAIGCIITERGGGYTFYDNSRQKKVTEWSNDSVLDPVSEFISLSEHGASWSVTKSPAQAQSGGYHALHGLGYSEFLCGANGIAATQTVFLSPADAVKYYSITLTNTTQEARELELMFALRPVLGDFGMHTVTSLDAGMENGALCITNRTSGMKAYVHCSKTINAYSKYREAFTDADGGIVPLDPKSAGSEFFPSAASKLKLSAGETRRIHFSLGAQPCVDFSCIEEELAAAKKQYETRSGVRIADYSNEAVLSRWLAVQAHTARFTARTGFYQAGGAFGFRDQLQDCLALLYINPALVRRHILDCAARQFEEGDVLHWWHEPARGVRTRISDDRLFLPLVAAKYIEFTGDAEILDARVPYLISKAIPQGKKDLYAEFSFTQHSGTLKEHCLKAIEVSCDFGANGLCKMGTGDWNDGMDKVGENGLGTSVFVSQLLYKTICEFLPYVRDIKQRARMMDIADHVKRAVQNAFEGDRFVRAYTDSGAVIGSKDSSACTIDILTQSFAVLSGTGTTEQCGCALRTCEERLFDPEHNIIKLLDPPFQDTPDIGYIADYPPGVRENGGQYTHAAVWFVLALLKMGETERAWKYFQALSPLSHTDTPEKALRYGNEPYVLSADIYAGEHAGRAGWSWYTGAASWYYVCLVEGFLGIKIRAGKLSIAPNLPDSVSELSFVLCAGGKEFDITIDNSARKGEWRLKIGSVLYTSSDIDLTESLSKKKITVIRIV